MPLLKVQQRILLMTIISKKVDLSPYWIFFTYLSQWHQVVIFTMSTAYFTKFFDCSSEKQKYLVKTCWFIPRNIILYKYNEQLIK